MDALAEIVEAVGEIDRMNTWSEVFETGGETDRLDEVLEICGKPCVAGTDSAREAHIKNCNAGTDSARQTPMEDVVPLRGGLRVISHEIQGMSAGKDKFLARNMSWKGCWDDCAHALLKQKSVTLDHIAKLGRHEVEVSEYNKKKVEMDWPHLILFLKEQLTDMDEQLVLLARQGEALLRNLR